MSKYYWVSLIAAAGWMVLAGLALAQVPKNPDKFSIPVQIIESLDDTEHSKARETKSDEHDANDLEAQRKAADASERGALAAERQVDPAWGQIWIAFFGSLGLLVSLYQTRTAIKDTRKIGQAEVRAYLSCDSARYGIRSENIQILIEVSNTGNSPAKNISVSGYIGTRPAKRDIAGFGHRFNCKVSHISGQKKGTALVVIAKGEPQYSNLLRNKKILDIDCTINWNDVFDKPHTESFIFGEDAAINSKVFGSKTSFSRVMAGYQDTEKLS